MLSKYKKYLTTTKFFNNLENLDHSPYKQQHILSLKNFKKAEKEIKSWQGYKPTPMHELKDLAHSTKVAKIFYKDESMRFNLKSFKALGGAYAVANLLLKKLSNNNIYANSNDLLTGKYKNITKKITVACATDGNHGKSVAWGAAMFGCCCKVFIHKTVSVCREQEIAKYKAKVSRINGNYDDSVRIAAKIAKENSYYIIADTSYKGYEKVPKDVMQGYSIMVDEVIKQIDDKVTHVFLQGGVGGLAAAVVAFFLETYTSNPPIFIIVEPLNADCLFQSAKNKKITKIKGSLNTIMAGLACGSVSTLAWQILNNKIQTFISISDGPIDDVMRYLANMKKPIIAGESAVAGLAGFLIISNSETYKKKIHIDENSKILFFGSEGDTDELAFKKIVGRTAAEILQNNQ